MRELRNLWLILFAEPKNGVRMSWLQEWFLALIIGIWPAAACCAVVHDSALYVPTDLWYPTIAYFAVAIKCLIWLTEETAAAYSRETQARYMEDLDEIGPLVLPIYWPEDEVSGLSTIVPRFISSDVGNRYQRRFTELGIDGVILARLIEKQYILVYQKRNLTLDDTYMQYRGANREARKQAIHALDAYLGKRLRSPKPPITRWRSLFPACDQKGAGIALVLLCTLCCAATGLAPNGAEIGTSLALRAALAFCNIYIAILAWRWRFAPGWILFGLVMCILGARFVDGHREGDQWWTAEAVCCATGAIAAVTSLRLFSSRA